MIEIQNCQGIFYFLFLFFYFFFILYFNNIVIAFFFFFFSLLDIAKNVIILKLHELNIAEIVEDAFYYSIIIVLGKKSIRTSLSLILLFYFLV